MRVYAIGDIHGCYNELMTLMTKIYNHADKSDEPFKIVFLGDYVDRGPDSKEVVEYLIRLREDDPHRHVFLLGNHDEMMVDHDYIQTWIANGAMETLLSYSIDLSYDDIPLEHIRFIKSLPKWHVEGNVAFTHASLDLNRLCEDNTDATLLWRRDMDIDLPHFHYKYMVHGHTPIKKVVATNNKAYVDTGCVFGNRLTALYIPDCDEPNPDQFEIIDVEYIPYPHLALEDQSY